MISTHHRLQRAATLDKVTEASSQTILLVDDDAVLRTFVKTILFQGGYQVIEAKDGEQGLQLYQQYFPALVILDAKMPGLDGFDCCRQIRELPDSQHVPILMVTGLGDQQSVNQAFEAGATDFVTKPVKMPVLLGRVRYMIQSALAEQSLRHSEERYRSLVTTLREVIFQLDTDGRLVFVNPAWAEIMGHSVETSLGQPLEKFLHPAERKRHRAQLTEVLKTPGQCVRYRSRGLRQDGQVRWLEVQLCADSDGAGDLGTLAGRLNDISDRTTREHHRRLEYAITRILAHGNEVARVMRRVIQALCGSFEFPMGEYWQLDTTGQFLVRQEFWHINVPPIAQFAELGQTITLPLGQGIPGANWQQSSPFWLTDLAARCTSTRRHSAAQANLTWALCIPINRGSDRWGMLVLLSQRDIPPEHDLLRLMTIVGRQLSQYLMRQQAEQQVHAQNQRLQQELQRAAQYVESLLPKESDPRYPATHETSQLLVRTLFQPSSDLGGDVFDYVWLDDEHVAFYLLDVAGHGIKSALLSVSVLNILHRRTLKHANFYQPESVLEALNQAFQVNEAGEDYFTLWYGVYHQPSRQLTYATAGHPPGLLITPTETGIKTQSLCSEGIAVGLFPDFPFDAQTVTVPERSRLYIFSDGVFEIPTGQGGEIWGFEAWQAQLEAHVGQGAIALEGLLATAQTINGHATLEDDFSILEVDFTPQ